MLKKSSVVLVFSLLMLGGVGYWQNGHRSAVIIEPDDYDATLKTAPELAANEPLAMPFATYQQFIDHTPSLQGRPVDGRFQLNEHGRLVVNHDVKRIFDFFLSALGEQPLAVIQQALMQYAADLPATDRAKLLTLFQQYLEAKKMPVVANNAESTAELSALKQRLAHIKAHRRAVMSAEHADVFFADAEAYDDYTLARLGAPQDDALVNLQYQLSDDDQQVVAAVQQSQQLDETLNALKQQNASIDDIYLARVAYMGEEKAARLRAMDIANQQWREKYQEYRSWRTALNNNSALTEQEKTSQQRHYFAQNFTATEAREAQRLDQLQP